MQFNPDPNKHANENIFLTYRIPMLNLTIMILLDVLVLDATLNKTHIGQKIKNCNKMTCLIRRLSVILPHNVLLTLYKSFISWDKECYINQHL